MAGICRACGKSFSNRKDENPVRFAKRKNCSQKCSNLKLRLIPKPIVNEFSGETILIDGKYLVNVEYYDWLTQWKWHTSTTGYAVFRGLVEGKKMTLRMHRLVVDAPNNKVVDHINHDRIDNRFSNLRICTQSDNLRNKKDQGKGYWLQKQNNNWVVEVNCQHIGVVNSEAEAAELAKHIRSGGTYTKPVRTTCKAGHNLVDNYYLIQGVKCCKICMKRRQQDYYKRKQLTGKVN